MNASDDRYYYRYFVDGDNFIVVDDSGHPHESVRIGMGRSWQAALDRLAATQFQCADSGVLASLADQYDFDRDMEIDWDEVEQALKDAERGRYDDV